MHQSLPGTDVRALLREARTVAVVGAHPRPGRAARYVPDYLDEQGYTVLPVNPAFPEASLWGRTPARTLQELDRPVDVVVVFRRSERVPHHLDDILAMRPLPRAVWLQLGIRNDDVARRLWDAGIEVIQDACILIEHRRLGIGRVGTS